MGLTSVKVDVLYTPCCENYPCEEIKNLSRKTSLLNFIRNTAERIREAPTDTREQREKKASLYEEYEIAKFEFEQEFGKIY